MGDGDEVQLCAVASFGLEDELALLLVERKEENVHRTVSHGQLELASMDARTVGEQSYRDLVVVAAGIIVLRTDAIQTSVQSKLTKGRIAILTYTLHFYEQQD